MTTYAKALVVAVLFALGLAAGWTVNGWRKGAAIESLKASRQRERADAALRLGQATQNARRASESLQRAADEQRKSDNAEIHTLSTRAADLARRVRNAEGAAVTARLVSQSLAASAGQAAGRCDQSGVLGSLGEQDVWEAERADKLRIALKSCYASYDRARAQATE